MKKLLMGLAIVSVFLASTAYASTINCVMYASENDGDSGEAGAAGSPITSDHYFTIEKNDTTGEVISFTNLFCPYWFSYEYGGWNTEDAAPFDAGEQIYKDDVTYDVSTIIWDGYTEPGHGLWFKCFSDQLGAGPFNLGIFEVNFDGLDGEVVIGPVLPISEHYVFHAVPIPSAILLLGSGLIWLVVFRKLRK